LSEKRLVYQAVETMNQRHVPKERRQARSSDTLTSLCRLLESTRRDSGLDALALADSCGFLVAGSGAARLCEELAALSSLPANDPRLGELGLRGKKPAVRHLRVDGFEISISALGEARDSDYLRISDGCRRILTESAGQMAAR
jgi:hypothetical protein